MSVLTAFFQSISKHQWVANSSSNTCTQCNNTIKTKLFSSRKHHCRNCGNIVCSHCSKNTIVNNRICDTCYSRFQNTESHYQAVMNTWNTIRPSNIHNDFCESHNNNDCMSSDRLFFFLNNYHLWLKQITEFYLNPLEFIHILSNYNMTFLLDDYHHIMTFHSNKQHKCMLTNCVCLQRNMRDSNDFAKRVDETRKLFRIENDKNINKETSLISIQQLLDTIHCFVSHKNNDKIHNDNKFITELISSDDDELKQQNNTQCTYGFGVEMNYWNVCDPNYCFAKYNDLKTELLMNNIYKLELFEYETIFNQAKKYQKTRKCKRSKARNAGYRNKMCGIRKNVPMSLNYIISVMLYCNNNVLQRIFKSTYRTTDIGSNFKNIISKHCEVARWARYLFESVVFYGQSAKINDAYYHGINQLIMFDAFETQFFIPISTTIDANVANRFSTKKGIIVEFGKTCNNAVRSLDVSCLSAFPQEKERLFVYGFLQFRNIWHRTIQMKNYILALKLFDKIVKGSYCKVLCGNNNQQILVSLIDHITNHVDHEIPIYIINLFKFRCNKIKQLFINEAELQLLNTNLKNLLCDTFIPYLCKNNNTIKNDITETVWQIEGENLKLFWGSEKKKVSPISGDKFVYECENKMNITFIPICSRDSDKNDRYFCFGFDVEYKSDIKGCQYEYDIFIQNNSFYTTAAANSIDEKGVRIPYLFPTKALLSTDVITIRFCIRVMNVNFVNSNQKHTVTETINNIVDAYYGMHMK
eukprot:429168_1